MIAGSVPTVAAPTPADVAAVAVAVDAAGLPSVTPNTTRALETDSRVHAR